MRDIIRKGIVGARDTIALLDAQSSVFDGLEKTMHLCEKAFTDSKKLMICGNGGSAADAQHLAAELVGRFGPMFRPGLAAIALTTDSSVMTAIGNDFNFNQIFSRQIEAIGSAGDVLMVITTSGNSENILAAVRAAKASGIKVVALTGKGGGKLREMECDVLINVPAQNTAHIQEAHLVIEHILCDLLEHKLFGGYCGEIK